jgi:hypothetical protein
VQNSDQLLEIVCDAVDDLQRKLHAETPAAQFLWNVDRPKEEEAISDWVKIELEGLLISRAVILNREVQIHIGDKTDIHVDAIARSSPDAEFERVKVIIEVKGCWNADQKIAMQDQLANRYLACNDCTHGIFLLSWFLCDSWSHEDRRRRQVLFDDRSEAQQYFTTQATRLSTGSIRLRAIVLDATVTAIRAQGGRTSARRQQKRKREKSK